jgi:hypothetical protein
MHNKGANPLKPALDQVTKWDINPEQSSRECACYQNALNKRLLKQVHNAALSNANTKHLRRANHLLESGRFVWSTPAIAWYTHKILSQKSVTPQETEMALELLEETNRTATPPALDCTASWTKPIWAEPALHIIENDLKAANIPCRLMLSGREVAWAEAMVSQGIALIQAVWPEAADEMDRVIRNVVLLAGTGLKSASIPLTFGAIYLCPSKKWSAVSYFDLLLHETAHHALVVKTALVRLLDNPSETARSPLRSDPRPLDGVLHAVFVLARVTHALMRLLDHRGQYDREDAIQLFLSYRPKLLEGLESLSRSARLTEPGEQLLAALWEGYAQVKQK